MKNSIIHTEDMTVSYLGKPVLWDVDLDIKENSRTVIIGPNGAGKSTLMKAILGIIKPISGYEEIYGKKIKEVNKRIAYIPQQSTVNWDFPTTVLDVVLMGRYVHLGWIKRPTKKDVEIARQALKKMEMTDFEDRQISMLSGGQKQRVFLARAIAQDADIYFMDEPLAGVDIKTEKIIMDTLKEFQVNGKTSVVVHHDLNTVKSYFDHIVIVNKVIVASGSVEKEFNKENIIRAYGDRMRDINV